MLMNFLMILMFVTAIFLIMLVLVQRGRGGGLAGALGGMGGQSAFGAKAGDVFTKITVWTAIFWVALCMAAVKVARTTVDAGPSSTFGEKEGTGTPAETGSSAPSDSSAPSGAPAPSKPAPGPVESNE